MQKQIAWNRGSGNITLTYQGEGDGAIAVSSDENNLGSARSQTITVQTTNGAVSKNVTIRQAACPFPSGNVANFGYTGAVQEITLPKGRYKIQCWGAQGGSNAAYSSYGITAQAGGKGGYSEGVLTLTQKTTLYIFVGGQGGSSGNGGWNGGGGGSGSSSYNSSGTNGVSRMGCGGGATDIALVTSSMTYSSYRNNRSSASLLSRIIVAGGGSGGAMCYKAVTTSSTTYETILSTECRISYVTSSLYDVYITSATKANFVVGETYKVEFENSDKVSASYIILNGNYVLLSSNNEFMWTANCNNATQVFFRVTMANSMSVGTWIPASFYKKVTSSQTVTTNVSQVGYAGGGVNGAGYSSSYYGKQNAAGSGGAFGLGANMTITNYRHCSACGGGGWYGGGSAYSDSYDSYVKCSGGGSGFVNTAANASYRPSGYTGLQLDSGTTTAGTSSFESTSGGRETGHSGNGYARITRLE